MILYGSIISPFVRKVVVFAEEKGVAIDLVPVGLVDQPDAFRAASPFGKMPALCDGDFRLSDSTAIVSYIEAKHPDRPLIPAAAQARGRAMWFDEYADTIVAGVGNRMMFNRVVSPLFLGRAGDASVADQAEREEWPAIVAYLNSQVAGRDYLIEDRLTLADIAVASAFASAGHASDPIDPARYPDAARYLAGIWARDSFARWLSIEEKMLAKARARSGG